MIRILEGDCRTILPTLPDNSVHCCVTSPPYYGLRDYGTAQWEGGDAACDHIASRSVGASTLKNDGRANPGVLEHHKVPGVPYRDTCGKCGARRIDAQLGLEPTPEDWIAELVGVFREVRRVLRDDGTLWLNVGDSYAGGSIVGWRPGNSDKNGGNSNRNGCGHVPNAKPKDLLMMPARLALALQADGWLLRSAICWSKPNPMPESVTDRPTSAYEMIYLFAKCKWSGPEQGIFADISDEDARWLAMFLDTEGSVVCKRSEAASGTVWFGAQISFANSSKALVDRAHAIIGKGVVVPRPQLPGRLPMFYLQLSNKQASDLLRRMFPFLLVKQRQAALAIYLQDVLADGNRERRTKEGQLRGRGRSDEYSALLDRIWQTMKALNKRHQVDTSWVPEVKQGRWVPARYYYDAEAIRETSVSDHPSGNGYARSERLSLGGRGQDEPWQVQPFRNARNVWTIATEAFPEAHFATFPSALAERCIKAGTSEKGCCANCGAPWVRQTETTYWNSDSPTGEAWKGNNVKGGSIYAVRTRRHDTTTGWAPSCRCEADTVPATVLDPFAGAGTTCLVADRLQRHAVGIELSPTYAAMARNRITADGPLFAEVAD